MNQIRNQFSTEDQRKTALFEAWNSYLEVIHSELRSKKTFEFEQMYEGLAHVMDVTKTTMTVRFEEANSVCRFEITEGISHQATGRDLIYIVAGKSGRKWLPLDIISVGSLIEGKEMGFHLTINPLHIETKPVH